MSVINASECLMRHACANADASCMHRVAQVLCASNATHDQVDPIAPPEGAAIGERITFEGFPGEPEAQLNPRKKVFERLAPDLTTNAGEGTC